MSGQNKREELDVTEKAVFIEKSDDQSEPSRSTWASQIDYVIAGVGLAVGCGNIWRFPYLCYKNGGGAFLIPYLLSVVIIAAPMMILETSLGQYTSSGCVKAWDIVPGFRGIGNAIHIVMGFACFYYVTIIAWALFYFYESLQSDLPWTSCDNWWNTERCYVTGMTSNVTCHSNTTCNQSDPLIDKRVDAVEEYWTNSVLQMSSGIDEQGQLVPGLTVALLAGWILVFLCICGGVRWTGKIVYITATVPYFLLTALLIRGLTLDGSTNGIIYYLKPNISRLGDARVWMDGATQVLFSMGVGLGFQLNLGSYNKFKHDCVRNSMIILVVNSLTSIYGGFAVFAILGFMAHELGVPIDKVVDAGPGLIFQTYPKAAAQMPLPQLWSALMFLTIVFMGLDSEFVGAEGFLSTIADWFPNILYKPRNRMILTVVYCVTQFLIGLTMVTQGGVYVFSLVEYYAVNGIILLLIVTAEAVTIGWVFGADRFYDCLEIMTGKRYIPLMKISWKYLVPIIIQGIFWFEVATFKPLKFDSKYEYPTLATVIGVCLTLSTILWIPGVFLYQYCRAEGSFRQRWNYLTTPILKPHQIHPTWIQAGYSWREKEQHEQLYKNQKSDVHSVASGRNFQDSLGHFVNNHIVAFQQTPRSCDLKKVFVGNHRYISYKQFFREGDSN